MKTLHQKLTSIIVLTSCLVLVVVGGAFAVFDHFKFEETQVSELKVLSQVIGANSIAAIDFSDSETATEVLSMLQAVPQIDRAALYAQDGTIIAKYQNGKTKLAWNPPAPLKPGFNFADQFLKLHNEIYNNGRKIGHIYLRADLSLEKSLWNRYLFVIVSVMILALLIALYIGSKLQTTITKPVMDLAKAAAKVSKEKDYSIRVKGQGTAEIQELVEAFNDMLDRIAQRALERDQAETELKKHRDHLEEVVHKRTAELEASNKELEAFSYSVSHDLRAPLRSIHGFCQILLEDYGAKLDKEGQLCIDKAQTCAIEMGKLIEDLLQLARISRTSIHKQKVDISRLAADTIHKLKQQEPHPEVDLKVQENLIADGDENLVAVALDNLIGNAWKYTSKTEQPTIELGCENTGNGHTTFYLKDNGVGFDMKYVDKIFLAFQRLHTKEEYPGTGVGLATVQRIIDRHGGKIWATSAIGKGTTIYFTLN